jgi:adenylate cyclase
VTGLSKSPAGKKLLRGGAIGVLAGVLALAGWRFGLFDRWEAAAWTWRVRYFAWPGQATSRIKLILLDQASLDWGKNELGLSWPWPREVYGPLIDFCRRGGAKAVAFDVLYTESSVYSVNDDITLGKAIGRSPPFAAALALSRTTGGETEWPERISAPVLQIAGLDGWLAGPRERSLVYPRGAFPIPEVAGNAAVLGSVTGEPDPDAVFRRSALFAVFAGRVIPILGTAAFLAPRVPGETELAVEDNIFRIDGIPVPLDGEGRALLRFRGNASVYDPLSAAGVIQSELLLREGAQPPLNPEILRDCYILFGFSAPGLLDLRSPPLSPVAPGVLIHATVLDNLLAGDFLRQCPPPAVIGSLFALALLAGVVVSLTAKAWQGGLLALFLLPLPWVIGFAAYPAGYWWPIIAGQAAVALGVAGALLGNYAVEGKQKAFIKGAFRHYLSGAVIEQLIANPSQLQLGGERKELSIFFSDIQKFSTFSEKLDPPTLIALLNDFLSDMTGIILAEGGTLDKYIGDAIVAFWNAPLSQNDHAARAVRTALRCQRKLAERRPEFQSRAGVDLFMRIGVNTGEVVVGNMGSRERFDYTVLGDAANLASRLEGANKAFGTYLMVSGNTWEMTGGVFSGRELGKIRVVGRKSPITVFEPWGEKGENPPPGWDLFAEALQLCYRSRWSEALEILEKLAEDPAARVYAARCRELNADPDSSWDGIWNLTEK